MKNPSARGKKIRLSAAVLLGASVAGFVACKARDGSSSRVLDAGDDAAAQAPANPALDAEAQIPANMPQDITAAGVWAQVTSDPYAMPLPHNNVTLWQFASSKFNPSPDKLAGRAAITVRDTDSISQRFEKLVHANGTCVKGTWMIDQDSQFTGHFAKGTRAPFIGRLSVAFNDLNRGDYRAFGLAGKLFYAGAETNKIQNYKTANFFSIDDLAGTKAPNITDVVFSNQPALTAGNVLKQGPKVAAIAAATVVAFKLADSNPGLRQLYEISEMGIDNPAAAVTPKWMHLKATTPMLNGHPDFREDLRTDNFSAGLAFEISVSSSSQGATQPIGQIVIDEMVASDTCDHRLHFHHPIFREDVNYGQ